MWSLLGLRRATHAQHVLSAHPFSAQRGTASSGLLASCRRSFATDKGSSSGQGGDSTSQIDKDARVQSDMQEAEMRRQMNILRLLDPDFDATLDSIRSFRQRVDPDRALLDSVDLQSLPNKDSNRLVDSVPDFVDPHRLDRGFSTFEATISRRPEVSLEEFIARHPDREEAKEVKRQLDSMKAYCKSTGQDFRDYERLIMNDEEDDLYDDTSRDREEGEEEEEAEEGEEGRRREKPKLQPLEDLSEFNRELRPEDLSEFIPDFVRNPTILKQKEQELMDVIFMQQASSTLQNTADNYDKKRREKGSKRVVKDVPKRPEQMIKEKRERDSKLIQLSPPELTQEEKQRRYELFDDFIQVALRNSRPALQEEIKSIKDDLYNKISQPNVDPILVLNDVKRELSAKEKPNAVEAIKKLILDKDRLRQIFDGSKTRPDNLDFETYNASIKDKLEPSLRQLIFGFDPNEDPSNPSVSTDIDRLNISDAYHPRRLFEALNPNMMKLLKHYDRYPDQIKQWVKLFFTPRGVWNEEGRWEPISGYQPILDEESRRILEKKSHIADRVLQSFEAQRVAKEETEEFDPNALIAVDESFNRLHLLFSFFDGPIVLHRGGRNKRLTEGIESQPKRAPRT